jgi:chromosome segregation ATPase
MMISNDLAKRLHDKATRSESLSAEEQAQLENWYALQDKAENKALGLTDTEEKLVTLQAQVDAASDQLMTVAKRIQEITSENESLRREIAALRRQLAHLLTLQPA